MNDITPRTAYGASPPPIQPAPAGLGNVPPATNPAQPYSPILPAAPPPRPPKSSKIKSVLSTLAVLLIAPLLALTITAFIFQSYEVDGPSMQTTLENHDRLIIWKVSRTWARLTKHDYIPSRGDVIVFIKKGLYEDGGGKEKQLIKRVIGLPGERVTVKDGYITVYNATYPNGFNPDKTLQYGKVITTTDGNVDVTVPAGQVFVSGDNRANSLDSRYFGPVAAHEIVGKLIARILPIGDAEKF